jgi:hypothetical protein
MLADSDRLAYLMTLIQCIGFSFVPNAKICTACHQRRKKPSGEQVTPSSADSVGDEPVKSCANLIPLI